MPIILPQPTEPEAQPLAPAAPSQLSSRAGLNLQEQLNPFQRVQIDYLIIGSSRISWTLEPSFHDPLPHTFQLQTGRTGNPREDGWQNIGLPIINGDQLAIDDTQRLWGNTQDVSYRVVLTTGTGVYTSPVAQPFGNLEPRFWAIGQEIVRKATLQADTIGPPGTLLKRRRYGTPCTRCLDPLTEEVTDSDCPVCWGTQITGGYYAPVPLVMYDMDPTYDAMQRDDAMRGASNDVVVKAKVLGTPLLSKQDVWVHGRNDLRWFIHTVKNTAHIQGVPLVTQIELRLINFAHIIYRWPLESVDPETIYTPPGPGPGMISVDQDYGRVGWLRYVDRQGVPVANALVRVFQEVDWNAGNQTDEFLVAATSTQPDGSWSYPLTLNPGRYVFVFSLTGVCGPDIRGVEVTNPSPVGSSSSLSFPVP